MSILATIQKNAHAGKTKEAETALASFLTELFGLEISAVQIRDDKLSLNSVNGFIDLKKPDAKSGASKLFFKFHHEENEEGLKEYYNSKLLAEYGFPVEMPLYASKEVGKQVLLYPVKTSERLADACKRAEKGDANIVKAQQELDKLSAKKYIETIHEANLEQLEQEPILQLFHKRLIDEDITKFGGRYAQFYAGKDFELPGAKINFAELSKLKWRINGVEYSETLADAFNKALKIMAPAAHLLPGKKTYAAVAAHGDAHNGNVWFNDGPTPNLSLFDPAFAGHHIPALLAEVKATFHNIFAHPLWLYDSAEADSGLDVSVKISGGYIDVTHNWELSRLRSEFLTSKENNLWKPLLTSLKGRGLLAENWENYVRSALFCCPTLVMNLRANAGNNRNYHTLKTSALGLSISIMLSSTPVSGKDVVTKFISSIDPK